MAASAPQRTPTPTVIAHALFVGGLLTTAAAIAYEKYGTDGGITLDLNLAPILVIVLIFWLSGGCWLLGSVMGVIGVMVDRKRRGSIAVLLNLLPLLGIVAYLSFMKQAMPGELGARCKTDADCHGGTSCLPHPAHRNRHVCSIAPIKADAPEAPTATASATASTTATASAPAPSSSTPIANDLDASNGIAVPAPDAAPKPTNGASASASVSASASASAPKPPPPRPRPKPPEPKGDNPY